MPNNRQSLTPRAFLELKIPHSPHLSPDGKRAVFAVSEADFEESRWVSHLWLASLEETAEGSARQITFSYEGERAPKWSPDGKRIAFLSSRPDMTEPPPEEEEDEHKEQVWILPTEGGEAQRLTNAKEGVRGFAWLPDGSAILYLCSEARPQPLQFAHDDAHKRKVDPVVENEEKLRRQFWEVGIEEKKPALLYTGDFGIAEFDIAPDGKRLVFSTNYTGEANDYHQFHLFVLPLDDDGEPRRLAERGGSQYDPRWSPDGTRIAFLSPLDPELSYAQECAWEVVVEDGASVNLCADVPYDMHHLVWSRGDGHLYSLAADRTNVPLMRVSRDSVTPVTAPSAVVECTGFDVGPDGAVVAVLEDDKTLPELYAVGLGGERRALTELNKAFTERYALPRQEVLRWQSDEWEIEGLVIYPPEGAEGMKGREDEGMKEQSNRPFIPSSLHPFPLIVQVHGGPKGAVTNTLRSYYQHPVWAAEGYLVLQPNFRGSAGYGNAFAVANRRDLGGGDFRDILRGVDCLIAMGLADPNRIGIMGGSYGGYMTNWAIGQTDRFAAAISQFGMFSLITSTANSEIARWKQEYLGRFYWEDPDIYRQCSPSTYLERIKTPVLILHGESDGNTFIANSKEMYHALRARGATVQFVHYPREGHGMREPNHKMDEMRRCFAWFDKYLKGAGAAQPVYRIGDKVLHDGYEMHVLRAEEADYPGRPEDADRLLEVAFAVASKDPLESNWRFALDAVALRGADGAACPLRGVPVDAGGGKALVEGQNLALDIHPDKDTGRLGFALAAVFQIPTEGGAFTLHIADFPPVAFAVGPKEEKEEGEEAKHELHEKVVQ